MIYILNLLRSKKRISFHEIGNYLYQKQNYLSKNIENNSFNTYNLFPITVFSQTSNIKGSFLSLHKDAHDATHTMTYSASCSSNESEKTHFLIQSKVFYGRIKYRTTENI